MIDHRIRIKMVKSTLWMRAGGRVRADAWQWVCTCMRVGPERTSERAAERGGSLHLAAVDRRERTRT